MQASAVGFDFDHTLGIDNKLEVEAFALVARRLAASTHRSIDEQRARTAFEREIEQYRSGRASLQDAVRRVLEETFGHSGVDESAFDAFRALAVELAPQYVRALPGAHDLLQALDARGIPYAILTNGWNPLQQRKAECIGFKRRVFVSDDLGVRKPSAQAFNVLRDHFRLPSEQIWYVGDDPRVDVVGALSAGQKAVWFDWEGKKYPTDIPGPTAIVKNLVDVLLYVDD